MKTFSNTRRVVAVLAVTAALCIDHVAQAAPASRAQSQIGQIAARLVTRLARNFRRTLPAIIAEPARQQRTASDPSAEVMPSSGASAIHPPLSPFQFRLPPPQ